MIYKGKIKKYGMEMNGLRACAGETYKCRKDKSDTIYYDKRLDFVWSENQAKRNSMDVSIHRPEDTVKVVKTTTFLMQQDIADAIYIKVNDLDLPITRS